MSRRWSCCLKRPREPSGSWIEFWWHDTFAYASAITAHFCRPPAGREGKGDLAQWAARCALGFRVHANNARVSLRIAVENAYPVTRRIVGADFFTAMAERFVASHPPNHGWLSAYGADFADFVAQYRPAADLGYLADVPPIECARVRAANAPDAPGLDLTAMARMDPEALEGLPLSLHLAASLVYSPFPAFDIWRAQQHNC